MFSNRVNFSKIIKKALINSNFIYFIRLLKG